jgi:hypothetical protein
MKARNFISRGNLLPTFGKGGRGEVADDRDQEHGCIGRISRSFELEAVGYEPNEF